MVSALTTQLMIPSVFKLRKGIVIPISQYRITMLTIQRNIRKMPQIIAGQLAEIHDEETGKIIKNSGLSHKAEIALISHLDIEDHNSSEIKIISRSPVGAFFEYGVKPHEVFPNQLSVHGYRVADWIASSQNPEMKSFIVGGPTSTLKKPGVQFMAKGFNKSLAFAPRVTNHTVERI